MRYRCFCMTKDGRIITGAFVEARRMIEARVIAQLLWQETPGFHHVQIWLGRLLLSAKPADSDPVQSRSDPSA